MFGEAHVVTGPRQDPETFSGGESAGNRSRPGSFVEGIPFGVWICNADGGLEYASESFLELLDMPLEEAAGFGWTRKLVTEGGNSLQRWKTCVEREGDWDDEHRIRDREGNVRTLLTRGHAVRDDDGRITSWVGVHLDITRRKREEERLHVLKIAEGRRQERERIAQRLHDHLQQLLIGANLQVQALQQEGSDESQSASLERVGEILTQAIEASRNLAAELNPPVLYQSGLKDALRWLSKFMRDTHGMQIELDCGLDPQPPPIEIRESLFDAVRELLLNVVKHAGVDRARVSIDQADGQVRTVVKDEGVGFDPADPCREDDPAAGIGLSGIRRRVEALGGVCRVESSPGKGTRVEILVPVQSASQGGALP